MNTFRMTRTTVTSVLSPEVDASIASPLLKMSELVSSSGFLVGGTISPRWRCSPHSQSPRLFRLNIQRLGPGLQVTTMS